MGFNGVPFDGIAMINMAEGAMDQFSNMLVRMKEIATQSANGIYSTTDRANLNQEFVALRDEITRIAEKTIYNNNLTGPMALVMGAEGLRRLIKRYTDEIG